MRWDPAAQDARLGAGETPSSALPDPPSASLEISEKRAGGYAQGVGDIEESFI